MTKNINILKSKTKILVFLVLLISAGCYSPSKEETYYYSYKTKEDSLPYIFTASKVIDRKNIRKIVDYRFNEDKQKIIDTTVTYFRITDNAVYLLRNNKDKLGDCLFLIKEDTCIEYNHQDKILNDKLFSKYCYLGVSQLNGDKVYEFIKFNGKSDGSKRKVYYNNSFILLKEEYIIGNCPNFTYQLTDNVPEKLRVLMTDYSINGFR
jgi:hypothetical protein